jgi:hypothetical protein
MDSKKSSPKHGEKTGGHSNKDKETMIKAYSIETTHDFLLKQGFMTRTLLSWSSNDNTDLILRLEKLIKNTVKEVNSERKTNTEKIAFQSKRT